MHQLFPSLDPHAEQLMEVQALLRRNQVLHQAYQTQGVIPLVELGLGRRDHLSNGLLARVVRVLVANSDLYFRAALDNEAIQDFRNPPDEVDGMLRDSLVRMWSRDDIIRRDPPLCLELETAHVFGPIADTLSVAKHKTAWGCPQRITPVPRDADLHPFRVTYVLLDNNPAKIRMTTRFEYKAALGIGATRLVGAAVGSSLRRFEEALSAEDRSLIDRRLGLSATQFWRDVKRGNLEHARRVARPSKLRDRYIRQGRPMLRDIPGNQPAAVQEELFPMSPTTDQ